MTGRRDGERSGERGGTLSEKRAVLTSSNRKREGTARRQAAAYGDATVERRGGHIEIGTCLAVFKELPRQVFKRFPRQVFKRLPGKAFR